MAELVIQTGKLAGKKLVLPAGKELVVGRGEECQVRLPSSLVSRQHCRLSLTPHGIRVEDLGSQNGTLVNDVPITEPTILKPGDTLRIGAMIFAVPSVPRPKKVVAETAEDASDADIAAWLDDAGTPAAGDTAEIGPALAKAIRDAVDEVSEVRTTPVRVDPVKTQISEIIRRHWAQRRREA
jgi:pSer/pThr/pTyr-binding forkhead associated (FHA) protein